MDNVMPPEDAQQYTLLGGRLEQTIGNLNKRAAALQRILDDFRAGNVTEGAGAVEAMEEIQDLLTNLPLASFARVARRPDA